MNSQERHEARYQRRKAKRKAKIVQRSAEYTNWDNIYGVEPLVKAYKSVSKASRNRMPTQTWNGNLLMNTTIISNQLKNNTWKSRGFNCFTIKERGKWRDIQSVHISEKGIQNTLSNNCLIPVIRPHLIYDNGASLKSKGTEFAISRFKGHLTYHIHKHGLSGGIFFFDFKSYFANIIVAPLKDSVRKLILDNTIFNSYAMLVDAFGEVGLGLGSQVSQISAIYYPNQLDHYIKDTLGIHGYARYMDDGYIICEDIERLKEISKLFMSKCYELGIIPNEKKCRIIKITRNFKFLKRRFFITDSGKIIVRMNRESSKKERHRLKSYRKFLDLSLMSYRDIYFNFHSWLLSLHDRNFHMILNIIKFFNSVFANYGYYMPVKAITRQQKRLRYIARLARP